MPFGAEQQETNIPATPPQPEPQYVTASQLRSTATSNPHKRYLLIVGGILLAILAISVLVYAVSNNGHKNVNTSGLPMPMKSQSDQTNDEKFVAPETKTAPKTYAPFTADQQAQYVSDCTALGNKSEICTCEIHWIEQHYTYDEYASLSKDPGSTAYEDMILGSYDDGTCTT